MKKNKYFRSDKSFSSFDNIQPQNAEFINQLDSIVLHRTLLIVEKQAGHNQHQLVFQHLKIVQQYAPEHGRTHYHGNIILVLGNQKYPMSQTT